MNSATRDTKNVYGRTHEREAAMDERGAEELTLRPWGSTQYWLF